MSQRAILILGASTYQLEAIRCAKALGIRTIVTDNRPGNPGHALADQSYQVDTTDRYAVDEIAKRENVQGVLAACTDVAVPTAAWIAERRDLPGVPFSAATTLTSKIAFRRLMEQSALPNIKFVEAGIDSTLVEELLAGGSCVMKPDMSSGSKGVVVIATKQDFLRHFDEARSHSLNGKVIVERFLQGEQGTCEGILVEGRIRFSAITERRTVPLPHTATAAHILPSSLPERIRAELLRQIETVFRMLGVTTTPFDCDFVVHDDQPFLLELTPRVGGNSLSQLIRTAYGLDLMQIAVRMSMGESLADIRWPTNPRPSAQLILGVAADGTLSFSRAGLEALEKSDWVANVSLDFPIGAPVKAFVNGRNRVGEMTIVGSDRDDLHRRLAESRTLLALTSIPDATSPAKSV